MNMQPLVSIIVEMGTREITNLISADDSAERFLMEARSFLSDEEFEIFFVGCNVPKMENLSANCHCLDVCGTGYYGWKNEGARAAKGKYLVFWDSDCHPVNGYLKRAVETLEKNKQLSGLTGATQYDGTSFFTRLNSVLNFGYLHRDREDLGHSNPMGHNLVLRKSSFPQEPFGPNRGRAGGDIYVGKLAKERGSPLKHDRHLQIRHEDISYSFTALMEQHFREMFIGLLSRPSQGHLSRLAISFKTLLATPIKRLGRVVRYGKNLGFNGWDIACSIPVLIAFTLIDVLAYVILALYPPLLDRWVRYQFELA